MKVPTYKCIMLNKPWFRMTNIHLTKSRNGISKSKLLYIIRYMKKCLKKYPFIEIDELVDTFSNEFMKTSVKELFEKEYTKDKWVIRTNDFISTTNGAYFYNEKKIILNSESIVKYKTGLKNLKREVSEIHNTEKNDVKKIQQVEELEYIERLLLHEFVHAIENQIEAGKDEYIKDLYLENQREFENIQEFMVECYITSEFTTHNKLANSVRHRIDKILKEKTERKRLILKRII